MIDMIGVGPFVTIPLMVAALGPQAVFGWILGAILVVADGLVWAELGAALPEAGGPVRYLRAISGPRVGGWLAFLFVFQLTFSAPLSMASGCIGFAQYAEYLWPALHNTITAQRIPLSIPGIGTTYLEFTITNGTFLAMATVATAVVLLYRRITIIGRLGALLWVGVVGTTLAIIFTGLTNFSPSQAFTFPPGAWELNHAFFTGLGAALLIAIYDYWGYYNVCYLGGEISDPGRVIPRAILLSIAGVAILYLTMNISILGAMPWQEVEKSRIHRFRLHGANLVPKTGALVTVMMLWTAFASVFSLLLGYSRVPYAAALEGTTSRSSRGCTRSISSPTSRCSGLAARPRSSASSNLPTSSPHWSSSASPRSFSPRRSASSCCAVGAQISHVRSGCGSTRYPLCSRSWGSSTSS